MTTVLICDERRSVREGLTRALSAVPGVVRIDCVAHGDQLLAHYVRRPADLVLVGTRRSGAASVHTRRLVGARPPATVIACGAPEDAGSIVAAMAEGARGYLRWDPPSPELGAAPAPTVASTTPASAAASAARTALAAHDTARASTGAGVRLSERERQVLLGMSLGKTNKQIGRELFVSEDTVKTHARRLFTKLGVHDRAQAVAHGFRRGLVS